MTIRPLFAVANPRDIPVVYQAHQMIRDKFHTEFIYFKYINQEITYPNIRRFFLDRPEFTHLVLASDDIVVTPEQYKKIYEHAERDYPVISAVMNLEDDPVNNKILNITTDKVPSLSRSRRLRIYNWETIDTVEKGVIPVKFSGFPLMFIRRDIIEQIELEGDLKYNKGSMSTQDYAYDLVFCYNCEKLNIPIYADTTVVLRHLKVTAMSHITRKIMVGKKEPKIVFIDSNRTEYDYTIEYNKPISMCIKST